MQLPLNYIHYFFIVEKSGDKPVVQCHVELLLDLLWLITFVCGMLFQLLQITRTSETTWETKNILPVSFASLIMPNGTGRVDLIDLRKISPLYILYMRK